MCALGNVALLSCMRGVCLDSCFRSKPGLGYGYALILLLLSVKLKYAVLLWRSAVGVLIAISVACTLPGHSLPAPSMATASMAEGRGDATSPPSGDVSECHVLRVWYYLPGTPPWPDGTTRDGLRTAVFTCGLVCGSFVTAIARTSVDSCGVPHHTYKRKFSNCNAFVTYLQKGAQKGPPFSAGHLEHCRRRVPLAGIGSECRAFC